MRVRNKLQAIGIILALAIAASAQAQHIGKYVPIPAGSDADHAMREITAATDPGQKLALIDKFAGGFGQGEMQIVTDELYVNYYLAQKNYTKTYEYGEKLFALDPDNFLNAMSMIRAASESGDTNKLLSYGEKTSGILLRFNASAAPSGTSEDQWKQEKQNVLQPNADNIRYVDQAVYARFYETKDPATKAAQLAKFAELFAAAAVATQALGVAACC